MTIKEARHTLWTNKISLTDVAFSQTLDEWRSKALWDCVHALECADIALRLLGEKYKTEDIEIVAIEKGAKDD